MKTSVLVTYHDECGLLTECLESLAAQTLPVDEILVYDDASAQPASRFVPPALPVRVIRGEVNAGPSRGRNRLLEQATGNYIHFHDADDWFDLNWHGTVRGALAQGFDAVLTEVRSVREDGSCVSEAVLGLDSVPAGAGLLQIALDGVLLVPSGTYLRSKVNEIGGYREDLWQSEDFDFHVRLGLGRPRVAIIPRPLVTIRLRQASRSTNRFECWRDLVSGIRLLAPEVPREFHPQLANRAFQAAVELHRLGRLTEAASADALARSLGKPHLVGAGPVRSFVYDRLPLGWAEYLAQGYRRLMPESLRRALRERERL